MFEHEPSAIVSLTVPEGPAWDEFVALTGLAGLVPLTREVGIPCAFAAPPEASASDRAPAGAGPVADDAEAALGRIADAARDEAKSYGQHQREVAEFVRSRLDEPSGGRTPNQVVDAAAQEIALATRLSPSTAASRTNEAMALADHLPQTLEALCQGRISVAAARVIVRETGELEPAQRRAIEESLLTLAEEHSPAKLVHEVRREILRTDPEAASKNTARETRRRRVEIKTGLYGMSWLSVYLDTGTAAKIHGIIENHGVALKAIDEADRSNDELRSDAFVDLILNPTHGPRPQTRIHVHINLPAGTASDSATSPANSPATDPFPPTWPAP